MDRRHLSLIFCLVKATFWLIRAPFVLGYWLYRTTGTLWGAWFLATSDSFLCPGCGGEISLVGRWECGLCNFVFDGFFFRPCSVCGAIPPYVQCPDCGTGVRNPRIFP